MTQQQSTEVERVAELLRQAAADRANYQASRAPAAAGNLTRQQGGQR